MELTTKQIISDLLKRGHTVKCYGREIDMIDELERDGVVVKYVGEDGWYEFIEGDIELRIDSLSSTTATELPYPPGEDTNTPSIPNGWEVMWCNGVGSTHANVSPVDMRSTTTDPKPTVVFPGQFWDIVLAAVEEGKVIENHMARDDSWLDITWVLGLGDISYETSSERPNPFIRYGEETFDIISLFPGRIFRVGGVVYEIGGEEYSGTVYVTPFQFCEKLYELLSPETPKLSVYSPDGEYKDVLHWYRISYDRDFKSGVHQMWVGAGDSIRLTPGTHFTHNNTTYKIQ